MPMPTTEHELAELFRALGAHDPDLLAQYQLTHGGSEPLRILFLSQAWRDIPKESDSTWIDQEIATAGAKPQQPYAGLGLALARCRDKGVADEDLTEIARCLQARMLFQIGYLIDGPQFGVPEVLEDVAWGLFQVDEEGRPFGDQIGGLHESVLDFDPTGRELRPYGSP